MTKYFRNNELINNNDCKMNLTKTLNSLKQTNFTDSEVNGLLNVIASIVLLKRIDFEKEEDCAIAKPTFRNGDVNDVLNKIERFLSLDQLEIIRTISSRQLRAGTRRKSVFIVQYTAGEAKERLNSFIEFLYSR